MLIDKNDLEKVEKIVKKYEKEIDLSVHVSNAEFIERQNIVQKELKKRGIDVGIFFFYREMPGDGLYLTGYDPTIERSAGFIGQEGGPTILAGPEAGLVAKEAGKGKRVTVAFVEEFAIPDEHYEGAVYHTLDKLLKTSAGKDSIKKIGLLTGGDLIPVSLLENLKKSVAENVEFVNAEDILKALRLEKSESEFACMKQANIIACAAMRAALAVIKPGLREAQIAAVGDYVMKSLGARGYGVESIVTTGDNCRSIVSPASNDVIKMGDMVQMGFCPNYQGYKGISRRVVIAGEPSAIQQEYLDRISESYEKAEKALYEVVENNLEPCIVDLAAREYFTKLEIAGISMKDYHSYSIAHGTGLTECFEPTMIGPETKERLGSRIGIMLDFGSYGIPHHEIPGGCVENAFGKDGCKLLKWTDLPVRVSELIGKGLI